MASLFEILRNTPKPLSVDVQFLTEYLAKNPSPVIAQRLAKPKRATLNTVRLNIGTSADFAGCGTLAKMLQLTSGVSFHPANGSKKILPFKDPVVRDFISFLYMFEEVKGNPQVGPSDYANAQPSGQYPYLSVAFIQKHVVNSEQEAGQKAMVRYEESKATAEAKALASGQTVDEKTFVKVSSFLMPNAAQVFNDSIAAAQPFYTLLYQRISSKADDYRARNKKIGDMVIQSGRTYTKINVTLNNMWIPNSFVDKMYFALARPAGLAGPRMIVDHYSPRSTCFTGDNPAVTTLKPGWKPVKYERLNPNPGNPDPVRAAILEPGGEITVYVKYDVIVS
jgi:hypothetical protein